MTCETKYHICLICVTFSLTSIQDIKCQTVLIFPSEFCIMHFASVTFWPGTLWPTLNVTVLEIRFHFPLLQLCVSVLIFLGQGPVSSQTFYPTPSQGHPDNGLM